MRLTIRVHPGAKHPRVGGSHDGALVVRVREPAVDGRATEAALTAVAEALAVPRRAVLLVAGATAAPRPSTSPAPTRPPSPACSTAGEPRP
jgi:uncharacterized protein YggU (UPF0235/DUF167 family)